MTKRYKILGLCAVVTFFSCRQTSERQSPPLTQGIEHTIAENSSYTKVAPLKLTDYGFFSGKLSDLNPAENVFPYDLNSPLFSDYALKRRFVYLPQDEKINYRDPEVLDFPAGTVLIKNFYYEDSQLKEGAGRIIETRLLVRRDDGWQALPYIWNTAQTEAYLEITGGTTPVWLTHQAEPIMYSIPSMAECKSCHELNGEIQPIGPSARQLNKDFPYDSGAHNQLTMLEERGRLVGMPDAETIPVLASYEEPRSATLEERARAYLEINCAHCHRPGGPAKNSGLDLRTHNRDRFSLGIGKGPVAAGKGSGGLKFDIVPGKPEQSILVYRMASAELSVMMPELGRKTVHAEGLELVRAWIQAMEK